MLTLDKVLILARKHVDAGDMASSAWLCLADAIALKDSGDWTNARARALKSLAYSVGIYHADYRKAAA